MKTIHFFAISALCTAHAAITTGAAASDYLKPSDYKTLCSGRSEGDKINRAALAKLIVERAGIPFDTLASVSGEWDSIRRNDYALIMADPCLGPAGTPANCTPFVKPDSSAPGVCPSGAGTRQNRFCRNSLTLKKANATREKLQSEMDSLNQHFRPPADPKKVHFGLTPKLVLESNPQNPFAAIAMAKLLFSCKWDNSKNECTRSGAAPLDYAESKTDYGVLCKAAPIEKKPGEKTDPKESDTDKAPSLISFSGIHVRGKLDDLGKDKLKQKELAKGGAKKKKELARFKSLSAAKISLRHDEAADKSTFAINAALGVPFEIPALKKHLDVDDRLKLLAFTEYERKDTDGDDDATDIHVVAPGLKFLFDRPSLAQIALAGKYTADLEQESKKVVGNLTISRTFDAISGFSRGYDPIDGYYPPSNLDNPETGVYLVPSVQAKFEVADILDPGTDMKLASAKSYYGIGGKAGVTIGVLTPKLLKNFTIGADIEHLEFVGGNILLGNATRYSANIRYAPPGAEHLFLQFEYVNGENFKTFQDEEYFDISVGIRY